MKTHSIQDLQNTFLIAMPGMLETWFSQAVILICEHNESGTFGLTINKPLGMQLGELFERMEIPCEDINLRGVPLYKGGPVQVERGFVLHSWYRNVPGEQKISEGLYFSTSKEVLLDIAKGEGPEDFLVVLGYAGWGAGQLTQEIYENAWLNGAVDNRIIFKTASHDRWEQAARRSGIDMRLMTAGFGHA